jgi:hypothetical protein
MDDYQAQKPQNTKSHRRDKATIRELTPELLNDFLNFFDHDAFADNPAWFGCYCMYHHFTGTDEEWNKRPASENRETMRTLIKRRSTRTTRL